jgi:heme A synthase
MNVSRFAIFAWGLLGYNVLVILWGALVRATGSGAGCGGHWPTCNGQAIPLAPTVETLIEYSHRLSSGLDGVLVVLLVLGAFRLFPKGHRVRAGALASLALTIVEGLIGASLVRLELVGDNASPLRGIVISLHLINTFVLLACLSLSAWWAGGEAPVGLQNAAALPLGVGAASILAVGASGAVAALGDTLFPAASLAEGLAQDVSPAAHLFVQLRAVHPVLAIGSGILLVGAACLHGLPNPDRTVKRLAIGLIVLVAVQWTAGVINVLLLAPVWMQLVHLLLADTVWITFVLMGAGVLRREPAPYGAAARALAGSAPTGD